ncbi:hypothetical protein RFI_00334 [Reticulomyxa filosa]|uniref:Uncharacterized protein n=1 Tax=Reticulomyxa filosa TaxID=46433 RepID=X6PF94_RETFI|nr:hypothetical protein RFI_00334 [Reticulomyxa filosa]|eukprot:ETO36729.1 hypothetical protein RFI_00334 [Reticulomyxa filosa]
MLLILGSRLGKEEGMLCVGEKAIRNRLINEKYSDGLNGTFDQRFQDTSKVTDIWNYIRDVVFKVLLIDQLDPYNRSSYTNQGPYYPLGGVALLGGIRLRQKKEERVLKNNHPQFQKKKNEEDKTPFLGNQLGYFPAYYYRTASQLEDQQWQAKYNTYSGGGHSFHLLLPITMNNNNNNNNK